MAELHWALTAAEDLQALEEYIARDSKQHAVAFIDMLVERAEILRQSPYLGRMVPEFTREDLRELLVRGQRILYVVTPGSVTVVRVIHGSRNLRALVSEEDLPLE